MATNSRHSHLGRHIPGCLNMIADRLSLPIITVKSPPRNSEPDFRGTPTVDMFATVQNMHFPQFTCPIREPRALAI